MTVAASRSTHWASDRYPNVRECGEYHVGPAINEFIAGGGRALTATVVAQ